MHGSSWCYGPHGFPLRSMRNVEIGFVASLSVPTKLLETTLNPGNNLSSRSSSKEFTCPQEGLALPQAAPVVRPSLMSCLNGTPTIISCLLTLTISRQALCKLGMCSNTSAQNVQSNELSANSRFVTSPATVRTRGCSNEGSRRSNAVTVVKCWDRIREK